MFGACSSVKGAAENARPRALIRCDARLRTSVLSRTFRAEHVQMRHVRIVTGEPPLERVRDEGPLPDKFTKKDIILSKRVAENARER